MSGQEGGGGPVRDLSLTVPSRDTLTCCQQCCSPTSTHVDVQSFADLSQSLGNGEKRKKRHACHGAALSLFLSLLTTNPPPLLFPILTLLSGADYCAMRIGTGNVPSLQCPSSFPPKLLTRTHSHSPTQASLPAR